MRSALISSLFILLFGSAALAQTKHPFTFEDMMNLKRVGEPVPSPDGKWVLFSAVDVDLAANKKTPHIWIVPLNNDTGVPHPSPEGRVGSEHILIPDQDGDRPRWAPDGKRFAFVSNKEGGSQIWIADFDTAAGTVTGVHKLTSIATEADGELWSPDGKNILFRSDVYPDCDDAMTREAEANAQEFCNARKLKEVENSKVKAIIFERLLYRHWNAYKQGRRSHLFIVSVPALSSGEGQAAPLPNPWPRDITPGDHDTPPFSLGGQDDYAFSPDGQEICYTSNHDKVEAISTNNDLWTVPVNWPPNATPADVLAKTKNITADNKASDSTPLYSPDGKYIAYRAQQRPGYESDRFRLMLYNRKTGEKKNLTETFDRWVGTFAWAPDSKRIYFSAENEGGAPLYVQDIDPEPGRHTYAGDRAVAFVGGFNDDVATTPVGKEILFTRMSVVSPNEIYRAAAPYTHCQLEIVPGGKPLPPYYGVPSCFRSDANPVTHMNDGILASITVEEQPHTKHNESCQCDDDDKLLPESFVFKGAHNDKVQGFLVKPPNFDPNKKYPVKFLIHGGPQGAWGDDWSYRWNPELFASPTSATPSGYVVIMINFHGSTGYGQKFVDAINGDWGGAPFEDLMKGLDYAEQHYPFIDKDRECALGASYGGYMANWVLGHTNRFKCIVSHDGMFNTESAWGTTEELWFNEWEFKGTPYTNRELYRKWSPHLSATSFKTPTLVVHGQLDYRLDVSEGFQLFTTLQRLGIPSKMLYFPDEGHWVLKPQNSQLWYKTVNDWVDQWVGKK